MPKEKKTLDSRPTTSTKSLTSTNLAHYDSEDDIFEINSIQNNSDDVFSESPPDNQLGWNDYIKRKNAFNQKKKLVSKNKLVDAYKHILQNLMDSCKSLTSDLKFDSDIEKISSNVKYNNFKPFADIVKAEVLKYKAESNFEYQKKKFLDIIDKTIKITSGADTRQYWYIGSLATEECPACFEKILTPVSFIPCRHYMCLECNDKMPKVNDFNCLICRNKIVALEYFDDCGEIRCLVV